MQHHPGKSYVQRHRATYYESATCSDVLGASHQGGRPFACEWHIETWYEPDGSKTSGGRNTTEGLQHCLIVGPAGGSVHATWEGARDATVADMRARAREFHAMALDLERGADKLKTAATPKALQGGSP